MDFRILGALEISHHGNLLPIDKPRTRAVLGVLIAKTAEVVSIDQLVDELWPDGPPHAARTQVHDYVSRVRRALRGSHGYSAANRLITRKPGYVLEVQAGELDRHQFEQLLAEARVAYRNQQLDHCLHRYRAAHRLWRGTPFAGVPTTPTISAATIALTELHVTSLEELFRVALECDAEEDLVVDLVKVVAANPLREILITQLMRAFHRAGRTADALALCRRTRQRLGDELGIGPSLQLQQTERGILRGERDPGNPWETPVPPRRTTAVRPAGRR